MAPHRQSQVLEGMHNLLAGSIEDSPRYVLLVVYPYQVGLRGEERRSEGRRGGARRHAKREGRRC
eukprot:768515-Hanusia_phi.AAC.5